MKTNHRRGAKKRRDSQKGYKDPVELVKAEARSSRRASDRANLGKVIRLSNSADDGEDVIFYTKNIHISNRWNWD